MKVKEIISEKNWMDMDDDIKRLSKHQQRQIDRKKNVQAHDELTKNLGYSPEKSTQALIHAKKHGIEPSAMVQNSPQYKMRGRGYKSIRNK
tara:strand:- start:366 stop:638 length:273 start_codon:yes stop_codon:yes gene_type:complete